MWKDIIRRLHYVVISRFLWGLSTRLVFSEFPRVCLLGESNTRPVLFLENTTRVSKKKKPHYFQHFEEILWQESCFNATFLPWPHYFQSLKKMTFRNFQRFKIVVQNFIISSQKIRWRMGLNRGEAFGGRWCHNDYNRLWQISSIIMYWFQFQFIFCTHSRH